MAYAEPVRPMPPQSALRSPRYRKKKSYQLTTSQLASANTVQVIPDRNDGWPYLLDCFGEVPLPTADHLADYLLENRVSLVAAPKGETHALWKLLPPDICGALALSRPGELVQEGKNSWAWLNGDSIMVRRGNKYGHLCNIGRLIEQETATPTEVYTHARAIFGGLHSAFVCDVGFPNGPGSIGSNILTAHGTLPDLKRCGIPWHVLEYAHQCDKGGRMEAVRLGTYQNVWCYDYTAAYAAALAELQDCDPDSCLWLDSTDYVNDAYYGFILAEVCAPESVICPMAYRAIIDNTEGLRFVWGDCAQVWLTKPEYDLLKDAGCGLKIVKASWGIPTYDYKPFSTLINRMFGIRDGEIRHAIKTITNAMIGHLSTYSEHYDTITEEKSHAVSPCWNPIYASYVRAIQRVKLVKLALGVFGEEHVLGMTIDGIISDKPINHDVAGLGAVRLEGQGEATLLTDYGKDRPGKPAVWRDAALATKKGKTFRRTLDFYGRLPLFKSKMDLVEAHKHLGCQLQINTSFTVGSATRVNPAAAVVDDYLRGPVSAGPLHISALGGHAVA